MSNIDSNFWHDGGIVVIAVIVGFTLCFIFAQLRGCEETRFKVNGELGVKSLPMGGTENAGGVR